MKINATMRCVQRGLAVLGAGVCLLAALAGQAARGDTVLFVRGTFGSATDYLDIHFSLPAGTPGEMFFRTYASAGGMALPPLSIGPGGIDSTLTLLDAAGTQIAFDDDSGGGLDSHIHTPERPATSDSVVIPDLASGEYRARLAVFGSTLLNGSFAMNVASSDGASPIVQLDQGFTVHGINAIPGVAISNFSFGQLPLGRPQPARLTFDSPAHTLVTGTMHLYGDHEFTLSAGTVIAQSLFQSSSIGNFGHSVITMNGGDLTTDFQSWGDEQGHITTINHSAGVNNAGLMQLGTNRDTDVTYNLSGSASVSAVYLFMPGLGGGTGIRQMRFLQSGGAAAFNQAFVGGWDGTGAALYRLTGGVATINQLAIRDKGVFELAGGTLALPSPTAVYLLGGRFDWLSGTVQLPTFTLDGSAAGAVFGSTLTLTPGKTLEVLGTTTNNTVLSLEGGRLITGTLEGPGGLVLNSGELRITGAAGLTVGTGGPLGNVVSVKPELLLNAPNGIHVDNASLHVQDGGRVSTALLNNNAGLLQLAGPAARIEGAGTLTNFGTLAGSGVVDHTLVNQLGGEVSASTGQTLRFTNAGAAHVNHGLVRLASGEMLFASPLTNSATGDIQGRGTLRTGGLTNEGDLALSNGVTDVHGDVTNQTTGRVIVSGRADVTFWDDVAHSGALFRVASGSSATFFGTYSGAGISGGGEVFFEDDLAPGSSPGLASFGGNVTFGPLATFAAEIAGTTPGSQHDQINIAGNIAFDGTLDVDLLDGFMPAAGDDFTVATYGARTGTFDTVDFPPLPLGLAWSLSYGATNVTLSVTSTMLPGDINLDGRVDRLDAALFTPHLGTTSGAVWATGDFDGDNQVTLADLALLQAHLGQSVAVSPVASTNAVPEPASCIGAAIGALAILLAVRRRPG